MLNKEDLYVSLRTYKLAEIMDDDTDDVFLNLAIDEAEQMVKDALYAKYDVSAIFGAQGEGRSASVMGWLRSVAIYKIYERVPDETVPERVVKNYDDTLEILKQIAKNQREVDLPRKINSEGQVVTKFRYGGDKPRSYN